MSKVELRRKDIIYPELSYEIIGILYEVYNDLGYGYKELYYQRAIADLLKKHGLLFKEQVFAEIKFKENIIGKLYLDFLIVNKVILEIKKSDRFSRQEIIQVSGYLKATGLKLGILAHFTRDGVKYKRILNEDSYIRKNS